MAKASDAKTKAKQARAERAAVQNKPKPTPKPTPKPSPKRTVKKKKRATASDEIFDTDVQKAAKEKARKTAQKEAEKAGARKTRRREAKDAAEKQAVEKQATERREAVKSRKAKTSDANAEKQRKAKARLKEGKSGNAFFKFRDEAFARGVFDIKQITKDYRRDKSDAATAARDKRDDADDREFAEQELAEESVQNTAPARAAIAKAGKIPRKRKQDGSGHGGDCGCDDEGQKDNVLLWVYPNLKNTRLFVGYDGRGVRLGSALLPQELENIRATGTKANNVVVSTGALQGEQQWERYVKPFTSQVDDGTMTQEAACRRRRHMKKAEPLAWHTTQSTASPHHSWFTAAHVLFVTTSHRAPHAFVSLSTHAMSTHTPLRLPDRGWLAWHRLQLRHLDGPAHSIMSLLSVCLDD